MIPRIFYCPFCKKTNTKTEQVYGLSCGRESKSLVIVPGDLPPLTTCVHCGKQIDTENIINGLHDLDPVTDQYQWIYFINIFLLPAIFKLVLGWPLLVAIVVGLFAGLIASYMIIEGIKKMNPKRW